MATEGATIVETNSFPAITTWPDDRQWERLDGVLSTGVWRRLMFAKRSLYAMNAINSILLKDSLGKADKKDSGAIYEGLDGLDVEAMRVAVIELGARAEELLTEVQDNELGCCGKARNDHGN